MKVSSPLAQPLVLFIIFLFLPSLGAADSGAEFNKLPILRVNVRELLLGLRTYDEYSIEGFGTFYLQTRKSYTRKNPRGKSPILIPEKRYLRFRPDQELLSQLEREER